MPGTTRYSATFDRPYEEEDIPAEPPVTRRSRSQSLQINSANGRPYTPLGSFHGSHARSSSTDSGPRGADSLEHIPTRTAGNPTVKASHNPFQFVKVGTCSLYKKAAEQMKAQVKKQPEVLKEEEEDWQSNLDSWKSRRRKMSEDVFRRQEELKQLEIEEESLVEKKKTKTFSEMVEERAHRGRTLSLCLFSNPLEFDDWNFNKGVNRDKDEENSNDSQQMSEGSEDSNNINSDDDNDHHEKSGRKCTRDVNVMKKTRRIGIVHLPESPNGVHNGVSINTKNYNGDFKESEHEISHDTISQKDESCITGMYIDSGLDSLSSSHRAGDIPDSGSDFSQDSGSSLDCDSPRVTGMMTTGMELLEEYSSKEAKHPSNGVIFQKEKSDGIELCLRLCLTGSKSQQYGFTISGGKDRSSPVTVASVVDGSISELVGLKTDDQILAINNEDVTCLDHSTIVTALKQSVNTRQLDILLWRPLFNGQKGKLSKSIPQAEVSMNEKCCAKSGTSEGSSSLDVKSPSLEEKLNNETVKAPSLAEIASSGQKISDDNVNNKKIASVKHKEISRRKPAPPIPIKPKSNEEIKILENTKVTDKKNSTTHEEKSIESENEMYVDDFNDVILNESKQKSFVMTEGSQNKTEKTELHSIDSSLQLTNIVDEADGNTEEYNQRVPNLCSVPKDVSLHIIYQSHQTKDTFKSQVEKSQECVSSETTSQEKDMNKISTNVEQQVQELVNISEKISSADNSVLAVGEVLPVDKVAEEMERMILQQLEQEEQLREKNKQILSASDHILSTADNLNQELVINDIDAPPRQLEPPKEKPPPPPPVSVNSDKNCGLKRVNSTKRIKKEMQKRRSDFLGIDNSEEEVILTDEDLACSSSSVEAILKSESEQDRQPLPESEPLQKYPLAVDEDEIARKEREIIEHLESEERKRLESEKNKDEKELFVQAENFTAVQLEEERIKRLQEERKRMEEERFLREEQRVRMEEERQLREREEFIRKQEEVIRKERERLRQEQEALQREREEHRRQIQEQEHLKKNAQKPHAPDVPISRTGPPPPIKPALPTPLTSIPHVPQGIREDVTYASRSHQGSAQNGQAGNHNVVGGTQASVNQTMEIWLPSQTTQLSSKQVQSIPSQTQSPSRQSQGMPPQTQSTSRQGQGVLPQTQSTNRQGQSLPLQTQSSNRQSQGSKNRPSVNEQWTHQKVAAVRKQADSAAESRYNQNHWLIQEAEMRRIAEQKERQRLQMSSEPRFPASAQVQYHQAHPVADSACGSHKAVQRATVMPVASPVSSKPSNYSTLTQMHSSEQQWNYGQPVHPNAQNRKYPAPPVPSTMSEKNLLPTGYSRNSRIDSTLQPPTKPSRVVPMERQEQMLSVSGRKRCSHCGEELGRGAAMIIESLQLFYHIQCFRCCVCQAQLGNGSCGTDVRVRNNKLHCHNCYSNDEAGLKFSQV